jgi:superfamily II DNA/RNA helicase
LRHIIRIENVKNAFIFCNRKRDVDILFKSLKKHHFDVVQLHGDMAQPARMEALGKFKSGEARLMVCSDVAARGIDIKAVSHVFNFDVPIHAEDYVHRIGRTGRAGEAGHAYTIATPDDGRFVGAIEKLIGTPIPRLEIEGVPALELDMEARKGRGGRGVKKDDRGERKDRGGRKPRRTAEPEAAPQEIETPVEAAEAIEPAAEPAPRREREPRHEREPRRTREPRREEARRDEARRDEPRRDEARREDHRRDEYRDRSRRDRGRRGRIDELGIGEMRHADDVIGFGEHMPDFMTRTVTLPPKGKSAADSDTED